MGSIAVVRAYPKIGGINTRVGIRALSSVYSGGVYK